MIRFQKRNGADDVVFISHNHTLYNVTMKHYNAQPFVTVKRLLSYKAMMHYVNTLLAVAFSDEDTSVQYNIPGFPSVIIERDDDEYETFYQVLKFHLSAL